MEPASSGTCRSLALQPCDWALARYLACRLVRPPLVEVQLES